MKNGRCPNAINSAYRYKRADQRETLDGVLLYHCTASEVPLWRAGETPERGRTPQLRRPGLGATYGKRPSPAWAPARRSSICCLHPRALVDLAGCSSWEGHLSYSWRHPKTYGRETGSYLARSHSHLAPQLTPGRVFLPQDPQTAAPSLGELCTDAPSSSHRLPGLLHNYRPPRASALPLSPPTPFPVRRHVCCRRPEGLQVSSALPGRGRGPVLAAKPVAGRGGPLSGTDTYRAAAERGRCHLPAGPAPFFRAGPLA